ncbi:hypothetical protein [Hymenobacter sp. CRA2]|uniref:hypothetical protein n=1 Tax=Hymenobacter sp. CRA2 TaxID=1955620 RepID=UPI00098EB2DA|nr:hypothetical protein [Hymenobacter sp. CRA2]OON71071.1 hypothetical protein B0919_03515 [Hymenobacter sp. CRA2]
MTSNKLVLGLAAAALLGLASCSSEPSDWRPDNKVSNDLVAPGTRESYDFDQATDAPSQHKGGAIETPISSHMDVEQTLDPAKGAPDRMTAEHGQTTEAAKVEGSKMGEEGTPAETDTHHDLNENGGGPQKN